LTLVEPCGDTGLATVEWRDRWVSWNQPATLTKDEIGAPRASAARVYCALAHTARCPTALGTTHDSVETNSAASMMLLIFRFGISVCRGVPGLSPNPAKSKMNVVYPRRDSRSAYTAGICSLTVSHDPVMITAGCRSSNESAFR